MAKKIILHLCADTGSDTKPYDDDPEYVVIKVGADIGVENYHAPKNVHGVIANPVCLEFSTARSNGKARNPAEGMFLVNECRRIIQEAEDRGTGLAFAVIENPAKGVLADYLGTPKYQYEPWWYGSPWTKKTALWGKFNIPRRVYYDWDDVPKNDKLYIRPGRPKPSLAFMHKSAIKLIPEFQCFTADSDMEFRSLCSQKFAQAFKQANP
ncbi:hypothetical protein [Polynucleobacter sp.]|uniref:hypothetical protein n=1 Tax=Polynucleobacter sp. TaxID=2029855 RepID=UPI003F6A292D